MPSPAWTRCSRRVALANPLDCLHACFPHLSLPATEAGLPARTQTAFAGLVVIGVCRTPYAMWVLRHRRILLANQRVVAAAMAVAFSAVFAAGGGWLGYFGGQPTLRPAAALGVGLLAVAMALLLRARRHRRHLLMRREALQLQIARRHD